jgi:hypothetical protein
LNRLPHVKGFIQQDSYKYENFEVTYVSGADPTIFWKNAEDEVVDQTPVADMKQDEINALMESKGFYKKSA